MNRGVSGKGMVERMRTENRPFDVLLVGGASGVGKSCVSYRLAERYAVNVVQVDDFQCIVEQVTREADYPVFHYWKNHFEEAIKLPMDKKLEIMIEYAERLSEVLEIVISNHLEENRPMILEGDFISPRLCKKLMADTARAARITCLFLIENDREQIERNFFLRENSIQKDRAELSWHYNNWLQKQIEHTGIIAAASRPWTTAVRRIERLIGETETK